MGIDDVLASARARLRRLEPRQAHAAGQCGAILVDIRPTSFREQEGGIPGALVVERNVLEWRLDPTSEARVPEAHPDAQIVVICNEGYASSLGAVSLQDLGLLGATDLVGGYRAWRAAGLPTVPSTHAGVLPAPVEEIAR
jgi:rhodanese-related sulfurtransferase